MGNTNSIYELDDNTFDLQENSLMQVWAWHINAMDKNMLKLTLKQGKARLSKQ